EQSVCAFDPAQHAAHRDAPAAPFELVPFVEREQMRDAPLKFCERAGGVEARRITADADVRLRAVVHNPSEITGREARLDEAMKARLARERHVCIDVFDADEPLAVCIET